MLLIITITLLNTISCMKNNILLLSTLVIVFLLLSSCIRVVLPEDPLKGKSFCDSCNIVTGRLFHKWQWEDRNDKYLDSVIRIIDYALPKCSDEQSKYDMSLRKLSSLCARNEYGKAFVFFDSIKFDGYESNPLSCAILTSLLLSLGILLATTLILGNISINS